MSEHIYRVYVWGMAMKGGNRVIETRRFKTEGGARRFAERRSIDTGKTTITTPTIDDPIGKPVAYYRDGAEIDTPATTTTTTTTEDTTMSKPADKKPAAKKPQAAKPAAKKPAAPVKIKTLDDVLAASDGQIAKAFADRRAKPLKVDHDAILKAAKSTDKTARYDAAYLRFLVGMTGSVPSNPKSTGIASGDDRAKRRAAIRKALAASAKSSAKAA